MPHCTDDSAEYSPIINPRACSAAAVVAILGTGEPEALRPPLLDCHPASLFT